MQGLISMVVMRILLRRKSLLESNMVQTIGSAGESLAGAWPSRCPCSFCGKRRGISAKPNLITLMILAMCGVVCIIMAIAGDTSQDLKTGFLLGATPKKQQIGEIIGVVAASVAIGGVLILLNSAWGFGSKEMSAPQASLMKMLIEGVMSGNLPWALIFIAATGFGDKLDLSSRLFTGPVGGVVLLLLLIVTMLWFSKGSENKNTALK